MRLVMFCALVPRRLVRGSKRFGETHCLGLQCIEEHRKGLSNEGVEMDGVCSTRGRD